MSHQPDSYDPSRFGTGRKTITSYVTGLVLSLALTFIAFYVTAKHAVMNVKTVFVILAVLALSQLVIQVVCFLRLNSSEKGRWNLMPFLFTIVVAGVIVGGSLWIMYSLNYNMMH